MSERTPARGPIDRRPSLPDFYLIQGMRMGRSRPRTGTGARAEPGGARPEGQRPTGASGCPQIGRAAQEAAGGTVARVGDEGRDERAARVRPRSNHELGLRLDCMKGVMTYETWPTKPTGARAPSRVRESSPRARGIIRQTARWVGPLNPPRGLTNHGDTAQENVRADGPLASHGRLPARPSRDRNGGRHRAAIGGYES